MRFEKWEGLGNDFIVTEVAVTPAQARALCDRRRGIGADGVLVVAGRDGAGSMLVLNADGSRPEMCGNGLRCVAGWLAPDGGRVTITSDAGPRACSVARVGDGRYDVDAEMGRARVEGELSFRERAFVRVDMGNPHAVCFDDVGAEEAASLGPALERATPGGINVGLCRLLRPQELDLRVWERGVGFTDACGTGACAAAAAAIERGLCDGAREVVVHLPGGALAISVSLGGVRMRGPAGRVFAGEVVLPAPTPGLLQ